MNLLQPYTAPRQGDPYWDNVVLHLKARGANASTVFGDAKGHPITPYGNAQISTGQSKFGGAAMYFDGTGDYLDSSVGSEFVFEGDYTIEMWVYFTNVSNYAALVGNYQSSTSGHWSYDIYGSKLYLYPNTGTGALSGVATLSNNTWYHIATCRVGSTLTAYINGVADVSGTYSGTHGLGTIPFNVGCRYGGTYGHTGYLDDLRITKGVARYTANFTPPAAPNPIGILRSPLDVLLMPFNGANGSTAFHDQTGKTVTAYGDANIITTGTQKFGSYMSLYPFTNSVSRIETPDTNDLRLTGDFTIDFWVAVSTTTQNTIPLNKSDSTGRSYIQYFNDNVYVVNDAATAVFSAVALNLTINTWYHFAVCKSGSLWYLFLNGTQLGGTQTNTGTFGDNSGPLRIGNYIGGDYVFNGYLDDLRITKGLARYTQSFDPPSRSFEQLYDPYTDWTKDPYLGNVVLHCPFNESVGDTKGHTVTAYGNAAVSATQSKLGGKSCYFDGTGDYLAATGCDVGAGDFTIDFWMRATNGSVRDDGLFHLQSSTPPPGGYGGLSLGINDTLSGFVVGHDSTYDARTATISAGVWYHIALVRVGSNVTLYLDGVALGATVSTSTDFSSYNYAHIGVYYSTGYVWDGYIDDFRITKGIARYTANFTPEARQSPEY